MQDYQQYRALDMQLDAALEPAVDPSAAPMLGNV
jgi:hypothetical protein